MLGHLQGREAYLSGGVGTELRGGNIQAEEFTRQTGKGRGGVRTK